MHAPTAHRPTYCLLPSPVGDLLLVSQGDALTDVHISDGKFLPPIQTSWRHNAQDPVLRQAAQELGEYFAGERQHFTVPLAPRGTAFQQRAWAALLQIPYGQTITYGQQAQQMQQPKAVRAVGGANGKNPIAILIPCHRVVGSNGALTGYSGGMAHKVFLLQLEGALPRAASAHLEL